MLIIIFVIPHHIPSPSSSSRSALSAVHSRREEFEQLSRDRRERMYVWIGIARFLSPAVGCYRHLLYNHHHIHHHSPSSFTIIIIHHHNCNHQVFEQHLVLASKSPQLWAASKGWGWAAWGRWNQNNCHRNYLNSHPHTGQSAQLEYSRAWRGDFSSFWDALHIHHTCAAYMHIYMCCWASLWSIFRRTKSNKSVQFNAGA